MRTLLAIAISCCFCFEAICATNTPIRVKFKEERIPAIVYPNEQFNIAIAKGSIPKDEKGRPLLARIFHGTLDEVKNKNREKSVDGCLVYPRTNVIEVRDLETLLDLGTQMNATFLRRNGAGRFEDTSYVLVIERGNNKGGIFKIDESKVDDYFALGFPFVLKGKNNSKGGPIAIHITSALQNQLTRSQGNRQKRDKFVETNRKLGFKVESCLKKLP